MKQVILVLTVICMGGTLVAQPVSHQFKPGFDARESEELLQISHAFMDSVGEDRFSSFMAGYRFVYRSPAIGLDNVWDLWVRDDSTVVVALRATTGDVKSLLADFYGAMMPARGEVVIGVGDTIPYHLADHPDAGVHAGWLMGFAYLVKDIKPKTDSLYQAGYRHFLVTGHSQGGALSYLTSAWLWYLGRDNIYPGISVKTYASASPKIGNMYFAYDHDFISKGQWTFSVVNAADMVPEFPFTTQQVDVDMTKPNPYLKLEDAAKKLPFFKRVIVLRAMKKMRKGASTSAKAYQKYFGDFVGKLVKEQLPATALPEAINSTYFVRPGVPITLIPDSAYYSHFEPIKDGDYYHHGMKPYLYLLKQSYGE